MPAVNTITQVGKREDLSDKLVVADAKSTPLVSMMPKGKRPANTLFSWPVSNIPAPDTTAIADGAPIANIEDLGGSRALLQGRVQKVRRGFGVSEMAEDVTDPAGIDSEFKQNKYNAMLSVKRAIEAVFCGDQDSSLVGTTHTCRGLGSWISNSAQTDLPVDANYRTPATSIRTIALTSLTEQHLRALMQSMYEQTGKLLDLDFLVGTTLKSTISTMTIYEANVASNTFVRTFFTQLKDATLEACVDVVKGDFGQMRLQPSLWLNWNNTTKVADTNRGYALDIKDIQMRANKLPGFKPLTDDDSGPRGLVSAIVSQALGNPLKHGKLVGS